MYKYKKFMTDDNSNAGNQLANYLNEHPSIKIVKIEFTTTAIENSMYSYREFAHLLYEKE